MHRLLIGLVFLCAGMAAEGPGTTTITVAKNGNARFAPHLKADVIMTIPRGTEIETWGPDPANPDWYIVRFPRRGLAWVHGKVLAPTNDERFFRVTEDGANVRSDSRINANLVTQLTRDEVVEWTGKKVGEWYSIYPSNAQAYMHHSVLRIDPVAVKKIQTVKDESKEIENLWQASRKTYKAYAADFNRDSDAALKHDWAGLVENLDRVANEHGDVQSRMLAAKLANAIRDLVLGVEAGKERVVGGVVIRDERPQVVEAEKPKTTEPEAVPSEESEPRETAPEQLAELQEPTGYTKGYVEQRDDEGAGTTYVLIDRSGEVVSYLKTRTGSSIKLSEFFWRRVGVKGERETIAGVAKPVITVSEVRLLGGG